MCTWPRLAALPGAAETLTTLSANYHLALATNAEDSGEIQIRDALNSVGLNQFIEQVFCSQRLGRHKPEREYFLAIAEVLQIRPEQMIMIGDSFEYDVFGAVNSGARALWLNTLTNEDHQGRGYRTIHSLHEIITTLSAWPFANGQRNY